MVVYNENSASIAITACYVNTGLHKTSSHNRLLSEPEGVTIPIPKMGTGDEMRVRVGIIGIDSEIVQ